MKLSLIIVVFLVDFFISLRVYASFVTKNECLLDFVHDEYEADENEGPGGNLEHANKAWPDHAGRAWPTPSGGAWPGVPPTDLKDFVAPPTGFHGGMDAEDLRERMGLDEAEDGWSQPYGGGRGMYGNQFGGGEAEDGWSQPYGGGRGMYGGQFGGGEEGDEREWGGDRRKRRRRQALMQGFHHRGRHSPNTLYGRLTCDQTSSIYIFNVTLGYTATSYCYQAFGGCQVGSSKAKQVMHCQGRTGSCDFSIRRHFLARCGQMVNFANVAYECVPASKRINICSTTNSDISGAVAIATPSYPSATAQKLSPEAELLTCECSLRAPSGSTLEVEYLRTHMSEKDGVCDGDMILLERPDQTSRSLASARYSLEKELCGVNATTDLVVRDSILRVTFLGGAPLSGDTAGFLGKFRAWSSTGNSEIFHVSCKGTDPASTMEVTRPPSRQLPGRRSRNFGSVKSQGRVGSVSGADDGQSLPGGAVDAGSGVDEKKKESKSGPGVLSGVVASLASVILIMASVGALIFYRRHKKRLRKQVEEAEYAEYQSPTYYDGVRTRREERRSRHSGASSRFSLSAATKRWSDSRLAEYGLMLVRMVGRNNHGRQEAARQHIRHGDKTGSDGDVAVTASQDDVNDRLESSKIDTGSATQSEIYSVVPAVETNEGHVKCFAEVHRSLKPPTRRAPPPPTRPPPVLNKDDSSNACPNPVAPPRRQKTVYSKGIGSTHDSPYDNVIGQDTDRDVSQSKYAIPNVKGVKEGVTFPKILDGVENTDNPNSCRPKGLCVDTSVEGRQQDTPSMEAMDIDEAGKHQMAKNLCESESESESKVNIKAVIQSESNDVAKKKTEAVEDSEDDACDDNSDEEENYTSILELNEALYNLEKQIRDMPS